MGESQERIFLLEFLVDRVEFHGQPLAADEQACVRFQFLGCPALDVCEEDFRPKPGRESNEVPFKSGKSVLFSVKTPASFESAPFDVFVMVSRRKRSSGAGSEGCSGGGGGDGKLSAVVPLGRSFTELVREGGGGSSRTVKAEYPLVDDNRTKVGSVTVFVRLSCFGKAIVTQFQMGATEDRSFIFEGVEGQEDEGKKGTTPPVQRTDTAWEPGPSAARPEAHDGIAANMPSPCMMGPGNGAYPMGGYGAQMFGFGPGGPTLGAVPGGYHQFPATNGPHGRGGGWAEGPYGGGSLAEGPFTGPEGPYGFRSCRCGSPQPEEKAQDQELADKRYKDISVEVNGHTMNIKILRAAKKTKPLEFSYCERVRGEEGGQLASDGTPLAMEGPYCLKQSCPMGYPQPPPAP